MIKQFTAALQKSPAKGGWTDVVMPGSAKFFETKGLVKVRGNIDGQPFQSSLMALRDGTHKLPVKTDVRKLIGEKLALNPFEELQILTPREYLEQT